jgi:lipoate-protein ligase A
MSDGWTVTSVGARHAVPLHVPATAPWHLIIEPAGRPGAENMAIDQALLEEADRTGRAFLRLYRWDPPCLSLGRNEPAIERGGIATVRRPTGGRAVWHEHEVTYAVAAPIAAFGRLRDAYRTIHERLAAALRTLGVEATLATDRPSARPPVRHGACFASPVGGEVLVAGRKVIGSAQVRRGSAFLQHGSILLDGSQEGAGGGGGGETTLREALGRSVTFEEVSAAIVRAWGDLAPFAAR